MLTLEQQPNRAQSNYSANPARPDQTDSQLASTRNPLIARQQSLGNQAVQRVLRVRKATPAGLVQRQATPGGGARVSPSEEIEDTGEGIRGADAPPITPPLIEEESSEEEPVQRKPQPSAPANGVSRLSSQTIRRRLGGGQPLDTSVRTALETTFGANLSGARIHHDAEADRLARTLRAEAFTIGNHIAFAAGRYQPGTPGGHWLLAHELAHVMQQRDAPLADDGSPVLSQPGDIYEREADRVATEVVAGRTTPVQGSLSEAAPARNFSSAPEPIIQCFSGSAAAAYARTWALSTNPRYGRFPNDCTNFASQAMEAGGWTQIGGSFGDRQRNDVWWFGKSRFTRASYTWGGAQNFANFLGVSGRGTRMPSASALGEGDVVQIQFAGSSHIGHTMVVGQKTPTDLLMSYHTSDHLDEPLSGIIGRSPGATFIYWKIS